MKKRKKLGVALGSGGSRGLYHVGVLKTLEKNNIPIDYLAGSSIGAWVAGHYALHKNVAELEELTSGRRIEKLMSLFEFSFSGGVIGGKKLERLLNDWLDHGTFSSTKIPFRAVATNLATGEEVVFKSGNLAFALRASMAIPVAFKPVPYRKGLLVDGGISNPVPDDIVRKMGADVVLAVDLMDEAYSAPLFLKKKTLTIIEILESSLDILCRHLAMATTKDADIILRPRLGKFANLADYFFGFGNNGEEAIALGERETKKIIPALRKKLE
jgi:NTE family protein